ncbi:MULTISPECIES: hypothetical protein [unclassified Lentimonas]|uniref:hypothetical protein n=1 Tax=unclassified Lentimonas TaxID=2630993 RepID=UPI0013206375|nr:MULTISPECIES: hypothetical protein [unclassified Lentimonas]CAA6677698.1 Unannotated [Lentimonas sp. CC4]CAA6684961.1 Unannotated [Lentimonas sp. CC6]CAA7077924.1 Unannotated [Lentimonas sp. CC4]CAA7169848.1 Unannotated [Lentimonas sp. CC21]CAA7179967.1 Unannotated [Lentimonas sp. CC8]
MRALLIPSLIALLVVGSTAHALEPLKSDPAGPRVNAMATPGKEMMNVLFKRPVSVGYRKVEKGGDTAMRDCVIDAMDALRYNRL